MLTFLKKYRSKKQRNNPLHQAVLDDDREAFAKLFANKKYLGEKNGWGLTPWDLVKCFHRHHFFSFFGQKAVIPPFEKEGRVIHYTEGEFFQTFGISYLHHLEFAKPAVLEWVIWHCKRALQEGMITREQKWLGSYYQKELSSFYAPPVMVKWIDSSIGWGVFAAKDLAAKDYIGEYTGYLRKRKKRLDQKNSYCFEYLIGESEDTPFTIDAQDRGNFCRFVNHSDKANCDPMLIFSEGIMRVILYANKPISKGEQIAYDYGPDYWAKREKPVES